MTLLNLGLGAAGLACIAIPIIIHLLFRRRRKPVLWGAMRFLLEAYRRQRRRLTLEQLLLLAARCAVVALIALAIGRPVLEKAGLLGAGSARTVFLLIDNGLASSALDSTGVSALERHKRTAEELLAALGPSDRVGLISMGAPADPIVMPASTDITAVKGMVEGLTSTDAATDLAGAVERVRVDLTQGDAKNSREAVVMVLSDFLTGSADPSAALPTLTAASEKSGARPVSLRILASRPATTGPANVQIVGVEPLRPVVLTGTTAGGAAAEGGDSGGGDQVRVRLRRTGPGVADAGTTTLRLRAVAGSARSDPDSAPESGIGIPAAQTVVRWSPGQSEATASLAVELPAMAMSSGETPDGADSVAIIAEIDRDSVGADNSYRRPITVREDLRVGMIARRRFGAAPALDRLEAADWLRLALRPSTATPIEVVDIEPGAIDAPALAGLSAVVLTRPDLVDADGWKRLRQFVDTGGLMIVFPPTEPSVHLWTDAMTTAMGLPWRVAREAVARSPAASLANEQPKSNLLSMVEGELKELVAPVSVERLLPIEQAPAGMEVLLVLQDGAPLIVAGSPQRAPADAKSPVAAGAPGAGAGASPTETSGSERGLVVYVAAAPVLTWTDMPAKPLMLPLIQELVRQGVGRAHGSWASVAGTRPSAPGAGRVTELRRLGADAHEAALPVDDAGRAAPVRKVGLFRAVDARGGTRGLVAVNADASAGRTDAQTPSVLQTWLAAMGAGGGATTVEWIETSELGKAGAQFAAASRQNGGSPVSLPLLIAAMAFALAETVMARFFSHAFREDSTGLSALGQSGGGA